MESNRAYKSICNMYHSQTQIVTRINVAYSPLCFATAKLSKFSGFCKFFAQKKVMVNGEFALAVIKSFCHFVKMAAVAVCCS